MAPEIIEHDDVALAKRWRQDLMYVESEQFGIDGAVENEGGVNPINPGFIDEDQALRINLPLVILPSQPFSSDVGTILLSRINRFF